MASRAPKGWFITRSRASRAALSNIHYWHDFGDFNFAFSGYLIINDIRYLVVIGQEGSGTTNGWWIAGQGNGWELVNKFPNNNYLLTPDKNGKSLVLIMSLDLKY